MQLSPIQKRIVGVGAACLCFLACYVPWTYTFQGNGIFREKPAGYYFIFVPPGPEWHTNFYGVKVNVSQVVITMTVVVIATIAGVLLAKPSCAHPTPAETPIEAPIVPIASMELPATQRPAASNAIPIDALFPIRRLLL